MANTKLGFQHTTTGATIYAVIRDFTGQAWDDAGTALESYDTASLDDYDIAATEQGTASKFYVMTIPATLPAGIYSVTFYLRAGGSPAESDVAVWMQENVEWDGTDLIGHQGYGALQPTIAGRTLDVANGNADADVRLLDGSSVNLAANGLLDVNVESWDVQDVSVNADNLPEVALGDTAHDGTIDDLRTLGLDHLVSTAVTGTDVADNSIVAKLVSKSATADWDDFVNTTESLQALKDLGDTNWITATGFATPTNVTDARDAVIVEVDANETKIDTLTTTVGVAGAGLTDLGGMSTAMKAEVNAEADTAITDAALATAASLATAQSDLDIITGADGVNLLSATQASIDAIEDDTNSLNDTKVPDTISLANINAEADTALADYDAPTYTELLNLVRLALRKDAALATDLAALITTVNADLGSGGGAFANTTDSQEGIRDNGDSAWITATGFSTHSAADVWTSATRTLTAATNITSDGSAIVMSASGVVGTVNLVNTTTTNTDMRGTDSAALATALATAQLDLDTITGSDGVTLATAQGNYAPLKPTTAGRTLDVTAGGAAGIDWGNVENQSTAVDLSATDIQLVDTCTTNSDMRGTDSAFLAASAPANFSALVISEGGAADSLVQGFLDNTIAETTADNIAANFETFWDNSDAITAKVVDNVGSGGGGDATEAKQDAILDKIATAQADLDIITGADGVNLLSATQDSIDAIETDANELKSDDIPGLIAALNDLDAAAIRSAVGLASANLDTQLSTIDTVVDTILVDTGTDGVVLTAAASNAIADAILVRDVDNVEATAPEHSLCTTILAGLESDTTTNPGKLTIFRTDGVTEHFQKTIASSPTAEVITGIS